MSFNLRSTAFLFAIAPIVSLAQQSAAHPDPADPSARSLPTAYHSVFTDQASGTKPGAALSPDKSWIEHNRKLMPVPKAAAGQPAPAATSLPATQQHPNQHQHQHPHGGRGAGS